MQLQKKKHDIMRIKLEYYRKKGCFENKMLYVMIGLDGLDYTFKSD